MYWGHKNLTIKSCIWKYLPIAIGKFDIDISRRPYIPAYVYNTFLKIAMSILPEVDVPGYSDAYRYLFDKDNFGALTGPRWVVITRINYGYPDPHAILYRRISSDTRYPLYLLALYAQNLMFQIAFPLHERELRSYANETLVPMVPYVHYTANIPEPITEERRKEDLHSTEVVKETKKYFRAAFDPQVLKNLAAVQLPSDFLNQIKGKKRPPNSQVD